MTSVRRHSFGVDADGTPVALFELTAGPATRARVMTHGATLVALETPDRQGVAGDIVLGFDTLAGYLQPGNPYMGATIGRHANRIVSARASLDGRPVLLSANEGDNHLHGGQRGFDRRAWQARVVQETPAPSVAFSLHSDDGDQGYPAALDVELRYTLTRDCLRLDYRACADGATWVNLTNHAYFNLGDNGNVLDHELQVEASRYLPVDATLAPIDGLAAVSGTPMDLRQPTRLRDVLASGIEQLQHAGGLDHNYALDKSPDTFGFAARLSDPHCGRTLAVYTNEPGLQVYSGQQLDGSLSGKRAAIYGRHAGLCLEAQHFPDSPNRPDFPTTRLDPGIEYRQRTELRFAPLP